MKRNVQAAAAVINKYKIGGKLQPGLSSLHDIDVMESEKRKCR